MSRNLQSETPVSREEELLTNAILWLPKASHARFTALVTDSKPLKDVDFRQLISPDELKYTDRLKDAVEIRHFILRRAFQRCFTKYVMSWAGHPSQLPMQHQRDTRTACLGAPDLCLSFSTSGTVAIAAATRAGHVGIDIEAARPVNNVLALSSRFFDPAETAHLASLPPSAQELEFLRFWTIKEACLKAAGKGIIDGLDRFIVTSNGSKYSVIPAQGPGSATDWTIEILELPVNCTAALAIYQPDELTGN